MEQPYICFSEVIGLIDQWSLSLRKLKRNLTIALATDNIYKDVLYNEHHKHMSMVTSAIEVIPPSHSVEFSPYALLQVSEYY